MDLKNYICYINLDKLGSCSSKCKHEHVNRPYVWKIMQLISGNCDPASSIANRIIKNDETEQIEIAFCDTSNSYIQIEYTLFSL